ncbi:tetratricopeptide repeat protein [Streptomyces sp. NPDC002602]|uniref:tetratricopeptide repeat protein n=1 Tax=Streptomyces sp. NPDC002602 TaxID=3364654 RepID=UPI0036CC1E9A
MSEAREGGATSNTISGGTFFHTVIQGRDITVQLPVANAPALSGLPPLASAFTGRDDHVDRLLVDLAPRAETAGNRRAVLVSAVSGLAGVGKTELVIQAAGRAIERPGWFPGGVLFTDLAGYDPELRLTPERALEGLLRALAVPGEHIPNGLEDRQRLYRSVLAAYAGNGRRILVIIDNASTTAQAAPLLPTDGTTAALVTSRHTLDGLDARLHDLDILTEDSSVAVLDQALRHARGDHDSRFADDPHSAALIARLCAGLPLALRIAAAVLAAAPSRPAATLATALQVEHTRLDSLSRPDRAVRAAFDLSYQLLPPGQARLFRLMPLNPGPDLSTDTAAHLADCGTDQAETLLQHLAEAHLIEPGRVWGRWRMHDLVRLHADELGGTHAAPDHRDTARTRLFTHYQDTGTAAGTHLETLPGSRSPRFQDRSDALRWLDAEHANLTATATAAAALGHHSVTISLTSSLAQYFALRRYFDDWIALSTTCLDLHRMLGDHQGEANALNALGTALREVRRFEEAMDAHTQSLAIDRSHHDRRGEAISLANLGLALTEARRFEEAIDAHTQSLAIDRTLGTRRSEGKALTNLGNVHWYMGRFQEAADAHAQAATIFRELRDRYLEGTALINSGLALWRMQRFEAAAGAYTQAVTIYRDFGDRHAEGTAVGNLGIVLRELGRFEEAIEAHTLSLSICGEFGDRHGEAMALANLGLALREVRRLEEAVAPLFQAATIFAELGDPHLESQALNDLGIILQEIGQFEESIKAHNQAATQYLALDDRHGQAMALANLGLALRKVQRFQEATEAQDTAAAIFGELGDQDLEAKVRRALATTLDHEFLTREN